jgi:hypothetical protein
VKTLTAPAETASQRPYAAPVHLMQIDFSAPSAKTIRVSDTYRVAIGQQWEAMIRSWGSLTEAMNTVDVGGAPAVADGIVLSNLVPIEGKARLSDLIRTPLATSGTYEWAFAKVTVYQVFDGLADADKVTLGVFYLEDQPEITESTVTIRMSDVSAAIEDQMAITKASRALFPLMDPDDEGKDIPIPIGVLTNVPSLCIVAGGHTILAEDIGPTNISIQMTTRDGFPETFVLQIDNEQMIVSNTDPRDAGFSFVIAQRGANGTTATGHRLGAPAWEVRSGAEAYRYVLAENRPPYQTKSVTNVKVADVLQPQATVDLDETTLVPGKSLVVINFPAKPVVMRQVDLAVDDQLGVSDNISVTSSSGSTESFPLTPTPQTMSWRRDSGNLGVRVNGTRSGTWSIGSVQRVITVTVTQTATNMGTWTISSERCGVLETGTGFVPLGQRTYTRNLGGSGFAATDLVNVGGSDFGPGQLAVGEIVAVLTSYQVNLSGGSALTKTGSAFRSGSLGLTGNSTADVVIGGLVTADLEGLQDDGSGTITGTPSALIRNPADVVTLILTELFPLTSLGGLGSTFAATRTALAGAGYIWDAMLTSDRFSSLRRKLGEQAQCALGIEGGVWQYRYLQVDVTDALQIDDFGGDLDTDAGRLQLLTFGFTGQPPGPPPADLTLNYPDESLAGSWKLKRTERTQVKTDLTVYGARDYRKSGALGERYRLAIPLQDTAYITSLIHQDLELDLIQDAVTATGIGRYWLTQWRRQRWAVEFTTWWNALALDKYDGVSIANHPVLANQGDTDLVFRVTGKRYLAGDDNPGRIALSLVEANP